MDNSNINKYVYIHIPRCAGTFTRDVLRNTFGIRRVFRDLSFMKEPRLHKNKYKEPMIVNRFELCEKSVTRVNWSHEEVWNNFDVVFGHFTIRKYAFMNWTNITFLRDPIERVISEYGTLRKDEDKYMGMSLEEYAYLNRNLLTWMLDGSIDKLAFIGFVEEYEESLIRLESFLNRKIITISKERENHSNYKNSKYKKYIPTDKERRIIESYNKLDIELYKGAYETIR